MVREVPGPSNQTLYTLAQVGWTAVPWNEELSLEDLANYLFPSASIARDFRSSEHQELVCILQIKRATRYEIENEGTG